MVHLYLKVTKELVGFTMKFDLRKLETAFPRWSASKFPFFAELFIPAFYHVLYSSQLRLLVTDCPYINLNGKLNPRLSWVLETSSLDSFTANKIILSRVSC